MKAKSIARWFVIAAVLLCTGKAHAQTGQFLDEFGASCKAVAMGQAFTAVADDFSAAYYNPAGLTQIKTPMALTIGYYYVRKAGGPGNYGMGAGQV